jgi:hypothetical protein
MASNGPGFAILISPPSDNLHRSSFRTQYSLQHYLVHSLSGGWTIVSEWRATRE